MMVFYYQFFNLFFILLLVNHFQKLIYNMLTWIFYLLFAHTAMHFILTVKSLKFHITIIPSLAYVVLENRFSYYLFKLLLEFYKTT